MNYNDYYNYVNGYNDMNYLTNPNNMIGDLNMKSLYPTASDVSNVADNNIYDSYDGFKNGNMFKKLYDPYKNYKPMELKASSEREDMLMQIQESRFAMIDLGLYLDIYPNDKNVLNLFNKYLKKEKEMCKMFENKYGPLTMDSEVMTNSWLWDNSPWPWEVQK